MVSALNFFVWMRRCPNPVSLRVRRRMKDKPLLIGEENALKEIISFGEEPSGSGHPILLVLLCKSVDANRLVRLPTKMLAKDSPDSPEREAEVVASILDVLLAVVAEVVIDPFDVFWSDGRKIASLIATGDASSLFEPLYQTCEGQDIWS